MFRAASGGRVAVETSRAEPSESGRVERFAGRLRAFDPKCTVGAREVEEAEERRRRRRKGEVAPLAAPLIGYVAHASP